jgi:hypothetical protein
MRALAVLAAPALLVLLIPSACKGGGKERIKRSSDAGPVEEVTSTEQVGRPKASVAEREPNERAAEGNALPLDAVGRGRIDSPTDVDRYRVTIAKPGALTVTVSGLAATDLVVELRDSSDAVLARSDRGGAKISEGVGGYPVTAGSYDVVVSSFTRPVKAKAKGKAAQGKKATEEVAAAGSAAAPTTAVAPVVIVEPSEEYEVIATFVEAAALAAATPGGERQELEPNPDAGAASDLAIGEVGAGLIGWTGDVDVWKVSTEVLAASNALDVEVSAVEGVTLTVEVRDGMSRPQTTRKGGRGQPVAIRGYTPKLVEGAPQILFVAVSGERSHPQLGYSLKVSARMVGEAEELEPNDKPELAQPFDVSGAEGDIARSTLHARWEPGDVDCFALPTAAVKRRVEVTVSVADKGNVAAELLVGERVVASSDQAAGALEHLVADVPAGAKAVVRVKAAAKPGGETTYDVSWAEVSADEGMPPEEGGAGDGAVRTP